MPCRHPEVPLPELLLTASSLGRQELISKLSIYLSRTSPYYFTEPAVSPPTMNFCR